MLSQKRSKPKLNKNKKLSTRFIKLNDERTPTPAEFIRQAVRVHCSDIVADLVEDNAERLAPIIPMQIEQKA